MLINNLFYKNWNISISAIHLFSNSCNVTQTSQMDFGVSCENPFWWNTIILFFIEEIIGIILKIATSSDSSERSA